MSQHGIDRSGHVRANNLRRRLEDLFGGDERGVGADVSVGVKPIEFGELAAADELELVARSDQQVVLDALRHGDVGGGDGSIELAGERDGTGVAVAR
jgi:hypothetical protein